MTDSRTGLLKNYGFPVILLISIAVGSTIGALMGKEALVFKPLGDVFINLMFMIVVPLVFCTITNAVAGMSSLKRLGKVLGTTISIFLITGVIAAVIMLAAVVFFPPAQGIVIEGVAPRDFEPLNTAEQIVKAFTVEDFADLFSRRHILPLIIFSILLGISLNALGEKARPVVNVVSILSDAMLQLVKIVMYYAPIGLGAYFATLVGDFGPQLLGSYARAMIVYHTVTFAYFFIAFSVYAYISTDGEGIARFWKNIITPAITALATGSSNATLPVNLEAARNIGVPEDIRNMVLPLGATIHMEGSCLSGILKISFLFGFYGLSFSGVNTFATAIAIAALSGVVLSGIPGGGLVGEMLIVSLYGFPPEAFPIIATIGFLVDPAATMVNATGDTASSMLVARFLEGKNWFRKAQG
ncbi:dicarboxylate/amino acid:cation symporter [Acetomicrobium hydrogeniformans]|uniref:Dicarboxylate/amino acid:cation symporter n=1 Tax=Acetomicrobium hydrogeniformans TaxID=649746 RepID=A0A7V6ZCZ5_9BACT|nr:dicarboxylate/amino acid:cation symporter [Acetomicrobium hydrogeniformans]HHZ03725.1 dicarboxylate/amino acid:cation symporter [Acetomicrobium hydrogeniformans]